MIKRKLYKVLKWPSDEDIRNGDYSGAKAEPTDNEIRANLVGSRTYRNHPDGNSLHAPVLDIDFPAQLLTSSTPGHYHLYLDKEMPWADYLKLLTVLAEVGIIEQKYLEHSIREGQTQVRKPGHVKKMEIPSPFLIRFAELRDAMNQLITDANPPKAPSDIVPF